MIIFLATLSLPSSLKLLKFHCSLAAVGSERKWRYSLVNNSLFTFSSSFFVIFLPAKQGRIRKFHVCACGNVLKRLVRKIHVVVERRIAKKCIEKVEVQVVILT